VGQAKRMMEEADARGWTSVDASVCPNCLDDPALKAAVEQAAHAYACGYCGAQSNRGPVAAPVDVVLPLIVDGLRAEYEDPIEQCPYDSSEGGWQVVEPQDTWDVLQDHEVTSNGDLLAALSNAVDRQWVQRDPFQPSPHQALIWGWEGFREHVTHRSRYMFLDPATGATGLGSGEIAPHDMPAALAAAIADGGLAVPLPAGTRFHRARPYPEGQPPPATDSQLGAPPGRAARTNRMSAAGISAFYGASSRAGAVVEVRAYDSRSPLAVGTFATARDMLVIDLVDLPEVPSLFDAGRRHLRPAIRFARGFAADVALPARPDDREHLDYLPTQVVAEYLRQRFAHPDGPVMGLLWRSSLDPFVTDCVLFVDNDGCSSRREPWDDRPQDLVLVDGSVEHLPGEDAPAP
jgi:hypothetical protein